MIRLVSLLLAMSILLPVLPVTAQAEALDTMKSLSSNKKFHGQWASQGAIGPAQIELGENGQLKLVTGDCNGTKFAGNGSVRTTRFKLVEQDSNRAVFEADTPDGTRRDTYTLIDGGMFSVDFSAGSASGTITRIARYGLDNPGLMCQP